MIKTIYSSNLIQEIINGLFKHFHFDTINHFVLLAICLYNSTHNQSFFYFRLEKLQKLAEKVHQEAKVTDSKLDDIEAWIEEEAKRVDHLHPKDAKNNCDQIERELQRIDEEVIKQMFNDVKVLRDNRYSQANELHRRYTQMVFTSDPRLQLSFVYVLK